ncbi:MAG: metallophosphoesterase [Clostridia bacterium]|nr:metallophosphoesterase [Clostridia bacterium]
MTYVMSDLHGEYEKYIRMLRTIRFSDDDVLYILGDVLDRGEHPIRILTDMSMRANVIPLRGNHEELAEHVLRRLCVEITAENCESHLTPEDLDAMSSWLLDGGATTIEEFTKLPMDDRLFLLEYLEEFTDIEEITVGDSTFVLTHAGLSDFHPDKPLADYAPFRYGIDETDYETRYYPDKYLVTGHIPTLRISPEHDGRIYIRNGHIAIDCGATFDRPLGCLRLDDMMEFYVK